MKSEVLTYMGTQWALIEDNIVTIGLNEDGLQTVGNIEKFELPSEGEAVESDEICGEITTDDGPLNIFSPVTGSVVEVNSAVVENPDLMMEDPYEEGWLIKIEADNEEELQNLIMGVSLEQ